MGGVKWHGKGFVGEGVIFDSMYPEEIEVENHVHLTMRCILLTHVLQKTQEIGVRWGRGHIHIKEGAFIGANTVICQSVTIGSNAIVGAGSVVTKDVPDNEIWAGNPAKFIKKREEKGAITETLRQIINPVTQPKHFENIL